MKTMYPVLVAANGDPARCDRMIVGEAPGRDELAQPVPRKPFVGRSGDVLYGALWRLGACPQGIYVTNAFKGDVFSREGTNHPTRPELDDHFDILMNEIHVVQPCIILVLGSHATPVLFPGERFGAIRGHIRTSPRVGVPVILSYHPARVVRNLMTRRDFEEGIRPFVNY